jgi:UDP-N-acetylglucosamine 2-epimerase (non-hydrolysing)
LCLLSKAKFVLTDSGGVQEETTALSVPCLTLRENTERPVTITQGTNEIVGVDPVKIRKAVDIVFSGTWKTGRLPELWDGHAAERIIEIMRKEFS